MMRTRPHYITLVEALPSMVLGAPVKVVQNGYLRFSLPAGHVLSEDCIQQLESHGAEYLFVAEKDERSNEDVAIDAAQAAHNVMQVFRDANMEDPTMAAFFDQVLAYRSA